MTVTAHVGAATPMFPTPKWEFLSGSQEEDVDTTPVSLEGIAPALRDAVIRFSETLEPIHDREFVRVVLGGDSRYPTLMSNAPMCGRVVLVKVGETVRTDPDSADPLTVFEQIQNELGITQKDLLVATGIKRRTFYSWKDPSTPRPRPSSLGRLWHLADALVDLREVLPRPVAAWLHSSSDRMAALKEGRFEDLVDLAVSMPKATGKTSGTSRRIGVVADVEVPVVKTGKARTTVVERGARR
ncbi:MAG TPA: hypothetical protein VNT31_00430 [Nocardioides sp.]|nr:hypothetical protein [Nocardioides sp.]